MAEGDPLVVPVVPTPEPAPGRRKIRCEFCETELGSSGEFVRLSDRAKKLRSLEESNEALEKVVADVRKENEELKTKIRESAPAPVASSRGW